MTRKVLISPDFGAGWSTWVSNGSKEQIEFCLFDEALIAAVEAGSDRALALADFELRFKEKFGDVHPYFNGGHSLVVVEVDGQFIVEEYDGAESILMRDDVDWH